MNFLIGCLVGLIIALFVLGSTTLEREQKAYMEGYLIGKSENKLSESSNN